MLTNLYQAYEQGSILSSQSPMQLIIALYEGGISAVQEALRCLEAGEIMARAKAVTKAHNILAELQFSLKRDVADTQDLAGNLSRLYSYMQARIFEAHVKRVAEPLREVEGLLRTMLEGWYKVAQKEQGLPSDSSLMDPSEPAVTAGEDDVFKISYGGYYHEPIESFSAVAFSF